MKVDEKENTVFEGNEPHYCLSPACVKCERIRVAEEIAAWLREGNVGPLNRVVIRENAAQEIERRWGRSGRPTQNSNIRKRRLRACVDSWPECETGKYDPRCCRFPKSCSCTVYDPEQVRPSDLEQDR